MLDVKGGILQADETWDGGDSWEAWGGRMGSTITGAEVWAWVGTGGGETLPLRAGTEDVEDAGKLVLVVEAAASTGATILLEFWLCAAMVEATAPWSCLVSGGSSVLTFSTCACLMLLKACCRVPAGADRDKARLTDGASRM